MEVAPLAGMAHPHDTWTIAICAREAAGDLPIRVYAGVRGKAGRLEGDGPDAVDWLGGRPGKRGRWGVKARLRSRPRILSSGIQEVDVVLLKLLPKAR